MMMRLSAIQIALVGLLPPLDALAQLPDAHEVDAVVRRCAGSTSIDFQANLSGGINLWVEGQKVGTAKLIQSSIMDQFTDQKLKLEAYRLYIQCVTQRLPAISPQIVPPPEMGSYVAFFDRQGSPLSRQALNTVAQLSDYYRVSGGGRRILVTGHTDTSEPDSEALARANAVKNALIDLGVPSGRIVVSSAGSGDPLVQTGPGVREPQNRRASIVLQ